MWWLGGMTLTVLFLPRFLAWLWVAFSSANRKRFGGVVRPALSMGLDTLHSTFLAPVLALFYSYFVFLALTGKRTAWGAQRRGVVAGSWSEAASLFFVPTLVGVVVCAASIYFVPDIALWYAPVFIPLMLSIPLARMTSSEGLGRVARRWGLFCTPEEIVVPAELHDLEPPAAHNALLDLSPSHRRHAGLMRAVVDPFINAIHVSLLRQRRSSSSGEDDRINALRQRLVAEGPDALAEDDCKLLLWHQDAMSGLHRQVWLSPPDVLSPWWRFALRHYNEFTLLQTERDSSQAHHDFVASPSPDA